MIISRKSPKQEAHAKEKEHRVLNGVTYQKTSIATLKEYKNVLIQAFGARGCKVGRNVYDAAVEKFKPNMHELELNAIIEHSLNQY